MGRKANWKMSSKEFLSQPHNSRDARFCGTQFHHDLVKEMLEMGKNVPFHAFREYEDLMFLYGPNDHRLL